MRRTRATVSGFKDGGRGPRAKEYGQPLEDGKGKETNFLLRPPECEIHFGLLNYKTVM